MRKIILGTLALGLLAACDTGPATNPDTPIAVKRFYAERFQDKPFDVGAVSVLTKEHGELHTFLLRPCRNNTRVCGSRTGTLERTPDYAIVRGAYPGRTFYLSGGGDGYVARNGQQIDLAWHE